MFGEIGQIFIGEIDVEVSGIELDAHQEESGLFVSVLVGMQDITAVAVDEVGDGGDLAFGVGATDEQDGGVLHIYRQRVSGLSCVRSPRPAPLPAFSEERRLRACSVRNGWCLSKFGSS